MSKHLRTIIVLSVLVSFFVSSIQMPAFAQIDPMPFMPTPGTMVSLSPEYTPAYLKGIVIHPENALKFDFIIYRGDQFVRHPDPERSEGEGSLKEQQLKKQEYTKLVKYFLASLAIPDDDQWVNLSPYEKDRIIKDDFGKTEMGRDLLAQDYLLKQITASLIYPQESLGKTFWDKVYTQAQKQYGTTNIPVNTFNKVWILPDDALIYEKGNTAYVLKNHLRVMLEEDYLSLQKHSAISPSLVKEGDRGSLNKIGSQIIKEIILPELQREVNEDKNFAPLRQVYSGMLLATWFKRTLKQSLLGQIYANQNKIKGLEYTSVLNGAQPGDMFQKGTTRNVSPSTLPSKGALNVKAPQGNHPNDVEAIYQRYLQAYKKGVFNFIKEDTDRLTNETIPRKYFSGGTIDYAMAREALNGQDPVQITHTLNAIDAGVMSGQIRDEDLAQVGLSEDRAMKTVSQEQERSYYQTTIDWVKYVFDNYGTRFAKGKLVFIGGSSRRAYEAARYLAESERYPQIKKHDIVYLDATSSAKISASSIQTFLEEQGVFETNSPVVLLDNWAAEGNTLDRIASAIKFIHSIFIYPMVSSPDIGFDSYIKDNDAMAEAIREAGVFFERNNYMARDVRKRILIGYERVSGKLQPYYLTIKEVAEFLESAGNTKLDLKKLPNNIILWLRQQGIDLNFQTTSAQVKGALRKLIEENPPKKAQQQDKAFHELLDAAMKIEGQEQVSKVLEHGQKTGDRSQLTKDNNAIGRLDEALSKAHFESWDIDGFTKWYTGNFNPQTGKITLYRFVDKEDVEVILHGRKYIAPRGLQTFLQQGMDVETALQHFEKLLSSRKHFKLRREVGKKLLEAYRKQQAGEDISDFIIDYKYNSYHGNLLDLALYWTSDPKGIGLTITHDYRITIQIDPNKAWRAGKIDVNGQWKGSDWEKEWTTLGPVDISGMTEVKNMWTGEIVYNKFKNETAMQRIVSKDNSMTNTGGIDLNSANLNLVIKRDGNGVPLPLAQQDLAQLSNIEGLDSVILSIKPASQTALFSQLVAQP